MVSVGYSKNLRLTDIQTASDYMSRSPYSEKYYDVRQK